MSNSDGQNIFYQQIILWSSLYYVIVLQNLSHKCYSHYSIIKFVNFETIYYAINLNVISSYMVFSEFVFVFLSMYC